MSVGDQLPAAKSTPYQPPWWMQLGIAILPLAIAAVLVAIYTAHFGKDLADGQDIWGQFGDFVGGTINPIVSWLTLIAVIFSIRYTIHALHLSTEAVRVANHQLELEASEHRDRDNRSRHEAKEQRTFQMYFHWTSPEMLRLRSLGEDLLLGAQEQLEAGQKFNIGDMRHNKDAMKRDQYNAAFSVWTFLGGLDSLLEAEQMEPNLFWKLMDGSIGIWVNHIESINFGTSERTTGVVVEGNTSTTIKRAATSDSVRNQWFKSQIGSLSQKYAVHSANNGH